MTVTVISRWKAPDADEAAENAKKAKALWLKNGAKDCRLNVVFTGPYTGQMIFSSVFSDLAAYAKASASIQVDADWKKLQDHIRKFNQDHGGGLEEREILIGVDM